MSAKAAAAIERARAAGLRLVARPGGRLRMEADREPSADLLAELRGLKADVVRLLLAEAALGKETGGIGVIGGIGAGGTTMPPMTPMPPMPAHPETACPAAGRQFRSPSWGDADDRPRPGDRCGCCSRGARGGRWWSLRDQPSGWCCWRCHPGDHVAEERRIDVET